MLKLLFFCVILFTLTIGAFTNPVDKERKLLNEILSKIDKNVDKCEDFGKYACGNITKRSRENVVEKVIKKEDQLIVKNFEENCKSAAENKYSINDIIEQFPIIKSWVNKSLKKDQDFNSEDIAEIAAYLSIFSSEGTFIDVEFDSEKDLYISIKKQENINDLQKLDSIKFVQYSMLIGEFIKDANKVILNESYINDDVDEEELIKLKSVEELKELIPTKHFDWEKYISVVQSMFEIKNINGIRIYKDDLEILKEYFKVIDGTRIETLMNYGIYKYISALYNFPRFLCSQFKNFLFMNIYFKFFWSSVVESKSQLRELQFFDKSFNESLGRIPNSDATPVYNYLEDKHYMITHYNEIFNKAFHDYEHDHVYKNLVLFSTILKKIDLTFAKFIKITVGAGSEFFFNYENKPIELFMIKEHFQLIKLFFGSNKFWENKDVAEECADMKLNEMSKFFNLLAAIEYSAKSFDNIISEADESLTGNQFFFIALTQNYCLNERSLEPIIKAFKYSTTFTEEFHCAEGSKMYYKKREECSIGYCPYESELLRSYLPFEFTDCK